MDYILIELENDNHFSLICGMIYELNFLNHVPRIIVKDSVFEKLVLAKNDLGISFVRINKLQFFLYCINPKNIWFHKKTRVVNFGFYDLRNVFYCLLPTLCFSKTFLFVHNVNSHYKINYTNLKYFLKSFFRNLIRKCYNQIVVLNSNICKFTLDKFHVNNVRWYPFKSNILLKNVLNQNKENIVLYPGKIDFKKKNYELFIHLASLKPDYKFILLGRFNVTEDEIKLSELIKKYYTSISYINIEILNDVSLESDFYLYMCKARFLFSEIIPFFKVDEYDEIYGLTKESGVVWDSFITGTPLLLNQNINVPKEVENFVFSYSDIKDILNVFLNEQEIIYLKRLNTIKNSLNRLHIDE